MLVQKETRAGLAPRRASYAVCLTTDGSEDALALYRRQAITLAARFGLTIAYAQAVAELAFRGEARQ